MDQFSRIFARSAAMPDPDTVRARLGDGGIVAESHFEGGAEGWFHIDLVVSGGPLSLERYLADEDGIRAELNAWAGVLETCTDSPHHVALMERVIGTRQLFVLCRPADHPAPDRADEACLALCRVLCELTDGFSQVDGLGFFDAEGALLARES